VVILPEPDDLVPMLFRRVSLELVDAKLGVEARDPSDTFSALRERDALALKKERVRPLALRPPDDPQRLAVTHGRAIRENVAVDRLAPLIEQSKLDLPPLRAAKRRHDVERAPLELLIGGHR